MHAFRRATENFEFELKNDDLNITLKDSIPEQVLLIADFFTTIADKPLEVINNTLTFFRATFVSGGDQREQLRKGVRYFALAEHYGIFKAAFPNEVIEGIREKHNLLTSELESLNRDYAMGAELIHKSHINPPLVASTGLITYATLNYNWFVYETNERDKQFPEYLYCVLQQSDFKPVTNIANVFMGTQSMCQNYVMNKQREFYGISLEDFTATKSKIEIKTKIIEDFEIVLDIPRENTIQGMIEAGEAEARLKQSIDRYSLEHLNLGLGKSYSGDGNGAGQFSEI